MSSSRRYASIDRAASLPCATPSMIVAAPSYLTAIDILKAAEATFVSIPQDEEGLRTDLLEEALIARRDASASGSARPSVPLVVSISGDSCPFSKLPKANVWSASRKGSVRSDSIVIPLLSV